MTQVMSAEAETGKQDQDQTQEVQVVSEQEYNHDALARLKQLADMHQSKPRANIESH